MQKWQREYQQFKVVTEEYLRATAEELLYQPVPQLSMEKFALFQKTGNRLIYEQEYFAKRKFLTIFGVAAQRPELFEEDKWHEICSKLEVILLSICNEETWALPAHVNPADLNWQYTIDLFAAETAQTLADIVDMVGQVLSDDCCTVVMEEVNKRVLKPFFESKPGVYGWEVCENNWNAVCNGCIGSAYLHSLEKNSIPNKQYLERICDNLLHYIDGFAEDGTCTEGLGYYFYGMTYFVNFALELSEISNKQSNLPWKIPSVYEEGNKDKINRIFDWWRMCYFDKGITVSFSDGSSREKYRMGLVNVLANTYKERRRGKVFLPPVSMAMTLEEDNCYRYWPFKMDVVNDQVNIEQVACALETYILPHAQWCIAQAKWQDKFAGGENDAKHVVGFACKGGHNDESHNHNDVGSFLFVVDDEMFLEDLGAGEYTKEYFAEGRYRILCNRSLGHNVPLINGKEQDAGAEYGCGLFEAAEIKDGVQVIMRLDQAYDEKDLKLFERQLVFAEGRCVVCDSFKSSEDMVVTENLITRIMPQIKKGVVYLEGGECICQIKMKDANTLRLLIKKHVNHQGEAEDVYLVQWDVIVPKEVRKEIDFSVEIQARI